MAPRALTSSKGPSKILKSSGANPSISFSLHSERLCTSLLPQEPLKYLYDPFRGYSASITKSIKGPRKHLKVDGMYVSNTPFTRNRRSKTIPIVLAWIGLASTRDQEYPYTFGSAIRAHSGPLTKEDPYGSEHFSIPYRRMDRI